MKFILILQEISDDLYIYIPVIFSKYLIHKDMAELHSNSLFLMNPGRYNKIVSAGDYYISKDGQEIFSGESTSLGIKCHELTKYIVNIHSYQVFNKYQLPIEDAIKI